MSSVTPAYITAYRVLVLLLKISLCDITSTTITSPPQLQVATQSIHYILLLTFYSMQLCALAHFLPILHSPYCTYRRF